MHVLQRAENRDPDTNIDISKPKLSFNEWQKIKIDNEVEAEQKRHEIFSEINNENDMAKPLYHDKWAKAKTKKEKERVIRDNIEGYYKGVWREKKYNDYYSKKYDKKSSDKNK